MSSMSTRDHDAVQEDPHQEAFRQFMLQGRGGGGGGDAGKHKTRTPTPVSSFKPRHNNNNNNSSTALLVAAFRKTLQQDWWPNDTVLYQVVTSIADLRRRIQLILGKQQEQQQQQQQHDDNNNNQHRTLDKASVFSSACSLQHQQQSNFFLTANDLQLALSHALRKHEMALHNLRLLLSQQASHQQALGRRLQDILEHGNHPNTAAAAAASACIGIFQVAATDLVQKQSWATTILSEDPLVTAAPAVAPATRPWTTIPSSSWSRTHPDSPWQQMIQPNDYPWDVNEQQE